MNLHIPDIGRYAIAAVPAVVAMVGLFRGPGALRTAIKHDADLLEKLPADSAAHQALLSHLNAQIERLSKYDLESRRDVKGFVIATVVATVLAIATVAMATQDHWVWWIAAIATGIVTLAVVILIPDYAARVPRDENDKPI